MLNGVMPDVCKKCHSDESITGKSMRLMYNEYVANDLELHLNQSNYFHYDLSLSNKCNQKCRMCSPTFSTSWFKDAQMLHSGNFVNFKKYSNISIIDDILDSMKAASSRLTIKLKGGEPLYLEETKILLSKMIEFNLHKKTENLIIITNGTVFDIDTLNLIKEFPNSVMSVSIDATGKLYEYIRGSNIEWKDCVEKWKFLMKFFKSHVITNSLMIYNFFNYGQLLNFVKTELNIHRLNNGIVHYPDFLSIKVLPLAIRKEVSSYKGSSLEKYAHTDFNLSTEQLDVLKNKFLDYTLSLDKIRNQDLFSVEPEFEKFLK